MKEDQAYKVPFDEQKQQALKDYSIISERASHWSGFIQAAIDAYQDPEVAQPAMKWIAIKNAGDCPEIDNSDFPVEYILRGHRDGGRGKCIIEQTTAEEMWSVASQYDWADYLDEAITQRTYSEQEVDNNYVIEFAKFYHNHVMETSQPPFRERKSINELYNIFLEFYEWAGKQDLKLYAEGWCQPGGSNGFHYSTQDLYQLYKQKNEILRILRINKETLYFTRLRP